MKFRLAAAVLVSTLMAGLAPAGAQIPPIPPGWQMERVVMLARHGVRAPDQSPDELAKYAASPWPTWPVPPDFLTPRGAALARNMGLFYRVHYGGRGLIQEDDCPAPGIVVVWTDLDQRNEDSAISTLGGLYLRCLNSILKHQTDLSKPDPLFHPSPSPSCPMDAAANRAAILARIGGDFSSVLREYAPQLTTLQSTLCPPGLAAGKSCGLSVDTSAIVPDSKGGVVMKGPIAVGSMASEIFLKESAEGMPADQVAWGRLAGDAGLRDVLKVHRLHADLMEKTRPIAQQKGSNMLAQITTSLQDGHKFPGAPSIAEPVRFGILIGHDTNILNVAGLLNLGWDIPGFQDNEVPPSSSLAFELYKEVSTGQRYVRMTFYTQTPEQMRQATPLSLNNLPGMAAVDLPACSADARHRACPLQRFVEIVSAAIDPGCVSIGNVMIKR
ncbi:MAG: histidine-type phosphatase [Reyranella sp.]|nr:histidine-type phosphatase [Reyranella sp.]